MNERSVPFDLQAERAVLGAILLERDAILAVSDQLQLGVVPVRFDAPTTRFLNLSRYEAPAGY